MRTFIVVGHKATITPNFSLEDIPGTSGRLDILCRCINAAFVISHGIRHDVRILLVLCGGEPNKTICLRGVDLRHLNPDERTTAALLKKALAIVAGPTWSMSTSGIFVRTGGLDNVLSDLMAKGIKPVYMREDGMDVHKANCNLSDDAVFILGDHMGMTPEEETQILQAGAEVVSIGPASLHADHCIVLVNWMLDTGMFGDQNLIRPIPNSTD
jgi:tRNA (pseudouridine54-N1)-methyltransferase